MNGLLDGELPVTKLPENLHIVVNLLMEAETRSTHAQGNSLLFQYRGVTSFQLKDCLEFELSDFFNINFNSKAESNSKECRQVHGRDLGGGGLLENWKRTERERRELWREYTKLNGYRGIGELSSDWFSIQDSFLVAL